jgi:ornithine lipid ester-linked acyl 2-hydroxylase
LSSFIQTSKEFPFLKPLEDNWEVIKSEALKAYQYSIPYVETDLYTGEWDVLPLTTFGRKHYVNCQTCPETWKLVESIPGIQTASFSILRYQTEISPHTGFTDEVLRAHLGLKIPEDNCALRIEDQEVKWNEGELFVFNDRLTHSAYNLSSESRIILIVDFLKEQ